MTGLFRPAIIWLTSALAHAGVCVWAASLLLATPSDEVYSPNPGPGPTIRLCLDPPAPVLPVIALNLPPAAPIAPPDVEAAFDPCRGDDGASEMFLASVPAASATGCSAHEGAGGPGGGGEPHGWNSDRLPYRAPWRESPIQLATCRIRVPTTLDPTPAGDLPIPLAGNLPPRYPEGARRSGHQGTVLLTLTVAAEGSCLDVSVKSGSGFPELDAAAVEAARDWRFTRAPRERREPRRVDVPVRFVIRGGRP